MSSSALETPRGHQPVRVLLVENDEHDSVLIRRLLAAGTRDLYQVNWVASYQAGLQAIQTQTYDVCLLDYHLGVHTGLEFLCESIELLRYAMPTILLTGFDNVEIREEVLHGGDVDYLVKGQVSTALLERSIQYARERVRTAAALQNSEQMLQATLDSLSSHIAILDGAGKIVSTNAAWNHFAIENGYQESGYGLGSNYLTVCQQAAHSGVAEAQAIHDALIEILAGSRRECSLQYSCHSLQEERWFTLRLLRFRDEQVQGAVVAHENVTARIEAERQAVSAELRFRALVENSTDLLILTDADGRISYISAAVLQVLGFPPEEFTDRMLAEFFYREDADHAEQSFAQVLAEPDRTATVELRMQHRAGHWAWIECSIKNMLADIRVRAMVVNSREITARKHAELAIRESESRYRELFDSAHDLVFTTDLNGRILTFNHAAEQILGYSRREVIGLDFRSLVAVEHHEFMIRMRDEKLAGLSSTMYEIEMLSRSGKRLAFEINTTLIYQDGRPVGILGISRDITARRRSDSFEQGRRGVLEKVAQNCSLPKILEQVAVLVEQQYPGSACLIRLVEETALPLAAATDRLPEWYRTQTQTLAHNPAASACGAAAHRGQPVCSTDLEIDSCWGPWRLLTLACGYRACWSFPLLSAAGRVLGTLAVYCPTPGQPEAGDPVLEKATQLAALTIEHRQLSDQLAYQAHHDALTGLPNRLLFRDRLQQAIARAYRTGERVAVLYLDLDNFKNVNDSLGHAAGDKLLREVANRLRQQLREVDTLARLGGDEFTITIADLSGIEGAKVVAQRVLDSFRAPFQIEGDELFLTASVGLSLYPRDGQEIDTLLRQADAAMYRAKMRGKNCFQSYSANLTAKNRRQLQLQTDLHHALERSEFELVYQPQVDLTSGLLAGFEVLLRWHHPTLGGIPPATFIPLAEESGLIMPIGAWVLEQACRQGWQWQQEGLLPARLGVNVSALQFARGGWAKGVAEMLAGTGLLPCFLDLELTESLVMHDVNESVRSMNELRQMGVGISIDDFGTGYSSLAYLQRLPINRVKIDVSFIREIKAQTTDAPLVRAIIELAHALGIQVVAEGVETKHQLAMLQKLGCEEAQGYLFGRPLCVGHATKWLQDATRWPVLSGLEDAGDRD